MKKLVIVFFLMSIGLANAAGHQWHWVKTAASGDIKWEIEEGLADVTIKGEKFSAKLYSKDETVRILLNGTLKNGKLKVNETIMETEVPIAPYIGTYTIDKEKGEGWTGQEIIVLSNICEMIGLTKGNPK